ncbi:TerB family tellurite resistance protein [Myroides odoratus]|uniref:TerB family tellurite resistance protein n=1 Tax=Myroides odoratus TaxID=256 RepID=UPI000765B5A7|nr:MULTISPECIES: TerB family tellurite resistance protein [Myroides]WHT40650.1 TerB family tellurite resistance protein [Myroides sp. mNGS23_01]
MAYLDLYNSDFKERNKGHFASIVRVALADGDISEEELKFLNELADKLDISTDDYDKIMANPEKYPVNPPYLEINRIERLYDLARMVYANHILGPRQKDILRKFASALGFTGDIDLIVNKSLSLLVLEVDIDTFIAEIQKIKH